MKTQVVCLTLVRCLQVYRSLCDSSKAMCSKAMCSKAMACLEEALSIRRRFYGNTHPDVASTLTNMGAVRADSALGTHTGSGTPLRAKLRESSRVLRVVHANQQRCLWEEPPSCGDGTEQHGRSTCSSCKRRGCNNLPLGVR